MSQQQNIIAKKKFLQNEPTITVSNGFTQQLSFASQQIEAERQVLTLAHSPKSRIPMSQTVQHHKHGGISPWMQRQSIIGPPSSIGPHRLVKATSFMEHPPIRSPMRAHYRPKKKDECTVVGPPQMAHSNSLAQQKNRTPTSLAVNLSQVSFLVVL